MRDAGALELTGTGWPTACFSFGTGAPGRCWGAGADFKGQGWGGGGGRYFELFGAGPSVRSQFCLGSSLWDGDYGPRPVWGVTDGGWAVADGGWGVTDGGGGGNRCQLGG